MSSGKPTTSRSWHKLCVKSLLLLLTNAVPGIADNCHGSGRDSMKVVRLHFLLFEIERINPTGLGGNYPALVLRRARNDEERAVHDHGVFFLEKRWSIDDVGDAGFIFKTQDKSLLSECATGIYHLLLSQSEHPSSTFHACAIAWGCSPLPGPSTLVVGQHAGILPQV
jgi:hypothetical protein